MEFIQQNVMEVSAVIGAVFIIARVVVYFTPTEADNRALQEIMKWVSRINFILGLDLSRGVKKYGPK